MLNEQIINVMKPLINNGYECYLVGGAVRDYVLGKVPKDYDFTTNALPDTIEAIYDKTIPTGKDYGTISVVMDDQTYEITTYRKDLDYDGRRPKAVSFSETLKEDLERRDFTMNALAMSIEGEVVDYFGGVEDIKNGIIKCVGKPEVRFKEDALRQVRAIRFATCYDFKIEEGTYQAIDGNIDHISCERLREEFNKMLLANKPSVGIRLIMDCDMYSAFHLGSLYTCIGFDQKSPYHDKTIYEHTLFALDYTKKDLVLRIATLLHDIGKPTCYAFIDGKGTFYNHHAVSEELATGILRHLKYSNDVMKRVSLLIHYHMAKHSHMTDKSIKRFIRKIGEENLSNMFQLMIVDRLATKPPVDFEDIYKLKFRCEEILSRQEPLSIKDLSIDGNDLKTIGFAQGKEIGDVLKVLLEKVLENPEMNNKEQLIKLIKEIKNEAH